MPSSPQAGGFMVLPLQALSIPPFGSARVSNIPRLGLSWTRGVQAPTQTWLHRPHTAPSPLPRRHANQAMLANGMLSRSTRSSHKQLPFQNHLARGATAIGNALQNEFRSCLAHLLDWLGMHGHSE